MKPIWSVLAVLLTGMLLTGLTVGCRNDDDDDDDLGAIIAMGILRGIGSGSTETAATIDNLEEDKTLSVTVDWTNTDQRVRARIVEVCGPAIADQASLTSPFTISGSATTGKVYDVTIGNPDGPADMDVEYTVYSR